MKVFDTKLGEAICSDSNEYIAKVIKDNSLDLIITSPPFALERKKSYGNPSGEEYLEWIENYGNLFFKKLKDTGSLVIDFGGSWNKGEPTRKLHQFKIPIIFCEQIGFKLAQEFFWWNTSKIPSPAQWVTIKRQRVTDAVNYIFWFSKSSFPKANNRKILKPYSKKMEQLIANQKYNKNLRPSEHRISDIWGRNNKGAIPQNCLPYGNSAFDPYLKYCDENNYEKHPARFGHFIPEFFIRFLTDENDLVLDPFAGSCTTGAVAEALNRKWICIDNYPEYLKGGEGRFKEGYKFNIKPDDSIDYKIDLE